MLHGLTQQTDLGVLPQAQPMCFSGCRSMLHGRFTCFSAVRPELFVSSPLLGQVLRQVLLNPPWAAVLASVLRGLNHFTGLYFN